MPVAPERPPIVAVLTFLAALGLWATTLMTGGTTLSPAPARSAGAAAWVAGIVVLVGFVVARGRWAQRLGVGLMVSAVVPAAFIESWVGFGVGVLLAGAAGVALLVGPSARWIRPGRSVEAPPDAAVVLMIAFVVWPLVGAPLAGHPLGLVLWVGPVLAFWYGRATQLGLWVARFGPVLALIAAVGAGPMGWLLAGAIAVVTAWWAWQPEARLAVLPLTGRPSTGVCPTPDFDVVTRITRSDA